MSTFTSPKVSLSASLSRLGKPSELLAVSETRDRSLAAGSGVASSTNSRRDIATAPIICLCHLSWDWVWQRPQQFLSRFSRNHPVLFVETYCSDTPKAHARLRSPAGYPNLTVAEVHVPQAIWHDGAAVDLHRRLVLQSVLTQELAGKFEHPILWFYDPMAVDSYVGHLNERLVVYDCMDELSQFKGAPPELVAREKRLLKAADVVFCGGRKMREKRLPLNPNCHFYGTGVDIAHFGKARQADQPIADELAKLKGPILGYFGVVDERIDYDLLAKLADARSDWHVVMVGPTAKVDPNEFPKRENLHFIGGRPYEQLPALTKAFSVCLMPFAINAATEYINPTKALEYMAAGKPVVSTAINEVKSNFSSVARVASSHDEFVTWCVREAEAPTASRVKSGLKMAVDNTWEAIAAKMESHISDADRLRSTNTAGKSPAGKSAKNSSSPVYPVEGTGLAYV